MVSTPTQHRKSLAAFATHLVKLEKKSYSAILCIGSSFLIDPQLSPLHLTLPFHLLHDPHARMTARNQNC